MTQKALNKRWKDNKKGLEERLVELIGLEIRKEEIPLDCKRISEEDKDSFTLIKIRYNTFPSQRIIRTSEGELIYSDYKGDDEKKRSNINAFLLIPRGIKEKTKAILTLHQHHGVFNIGKNEVVKEGVGDDNQKYALELVNKVYVVLAPDSIGFEERQLEHKLSRDSWGERYLFGDELLHGRTLLGKNMLDLIRGMDILESLNEVDSQRIGCMGHSLGGTQTFYLTALDKRIKAAVSNCGISTISFIQKNHICHHFSFYIPELLKEGIDTPEILTLINPRHFLISATTNDKNFPIEGVEELYRLGKELYNVQNLHLKIHEGGHQFPTEARESAYKFLDENL